MSGEVNILNDDAIKCNVGENLENMKDGYPTFYDYDIGNFGDDASVSS